MNDLPDFSTMTRAELTAWLEAEHRQATPERFDAWRITAMRQTAGRLFHERRQFPLGSPERRERLGIVQAARRAIRQLSADKTEFQAFEFDAHTAEFIERVAADLGMTPVEFITEAMRLAFWRYRFAEGVQAMQRAAVPGQLEAEGQRVFARIAAAEKALDRKLRYPQHLGGSVLLLAYTANSLRSRAGVSPAEIERLECAIVAAIQAAVSLTPGDEAEGWTPRPDHCSFEAVFPEKPGDEIEIRFSTDRGQLGRVLLPPSVTLEEANAVADHAAVAFLKAEAAGLVH